ncbi:E3 ubiquitin-protein ligase RBBP6-like [Haliotis cracherodii]|uniref:E3 ubiquitin-protein ligase RBBP6-like n=1 Tax=Haliotis cracherodii TaxID=6455 RepID=UPI0039EAC118
MFGGNNWRQPEFMSSRKRKRDYEYDEVDPSKRLRGEPSLRTRYPHKHNFNNVDGKSQKYELFFGWRSPFSQHHPVTFTVDKKVFNCAEQYYMFRKAALFEDKAIEEKIMNASDPKEQKRLGKQIQNFNFDTWMQHSMEVVETGNMAKFSQNPNLKKKLFATSPRLMVEASPYDATWGIALHKNDPRAWDERTWQGKNLLGQILTKVRDNLMRQEGVLGDKEEESREKTGYNTAAIYSSDRYHRNNCDDMDRRRAECHSFSHRERSESYGQRTSSSGCPDSSRSESYLQTRAPNKLNFQNIDVFADRHLKNPYRSIIEATMFGGNNWRQPEFMSSRKRKRDYEYDEVDPSKRLRGEPSLPTRYPHKHNFNNVDGKSQKYELFFGWRSPFSQHHPVAFTVDKKVFNCAEQYYMYRKAALFEDKAIEEKIMNASDPKEQKRLGKQIQNFNFDTWMQHSMEVVETGNMAKFSQNPNLKKKLFATSPRLMVEASPYDATWGIALHKNDPRAWDERTWQGKNLLGQILTKVRDNLMRQEGLLGDDESLSREKTGYNTAAIPSSDGYHRNNSDDIDRRRVEWHRFGHRGRSGSYGQRTSSSGCPDSRRSESYSQTRQPNKRNIPNIDSFADRQSEKYELFFGWRSPFSQHHPVKFTVDNKVFNCAEQYYMYRKAALFKDKAIEEKIMNSSDPKEQKRLGKQIQNFNFDTWMQHSMEVVKTGNMAKFSQNPNLKEKLFATSPRLMVEASPYDATWGIALHKNDPRAWDERTWKGKNLLGRIITKVRDNLMRKDGCLGDKEGESREKASAVGRSDRYHRNTNDEINRRKSLHSLSHMKRSESCGQRTSSSECPDSHGKCSQSRDSDQNRGSERTGSGGRERLDKLKSGGKRVSRWDKDSDGSLSKQRSPVTKKQKTDQGESYIRGDSERKRDGSPGRHRSPVTKKQKTAQGESCSRRDSERLGETGEEGTCGRSWNKEPRRKDCERSRSDSQGTNSENSSSSSEDSDRGSSVIGQTSKAGRHLKKKKKQKKKKRRSRNDSQKKNDEHSSNGSEMSHQDRKERRKEHSDSNSSSKCEDLKRKERRNKTAKLDNQGEEERVDGEDNGVVLEGEERQDDKCMDTDKDVGSIQLRVMTEGKGSGKHGGQGQKSYNTEDGKRVSSSVRHNRHCEIGAGSEGDGGEKQSKEDTVTEKPLHGGTQETVLGVSETGSETRREEGVHQESKKDDSLGMNAKGESEKADEQCDKAGSEAEKKKNGEDVDETEASDKVHIEHVSREKVDIENTIDDKESQKSNNESKRVDRDVAGDDEPQEETMMNVFEDHKMATEGCGAEEGNEQVKEDGKGAHAEGQKICIKSFKKSTNRHYRNNKKFSDSESGGTNGGSRKSRKHVDSGNDGRRSRWKSDDRMVSVDRGSKDVSSRTSRSTSETRHASRRYIADSETSRNHKRDRSSRKCSVDRMSQGKDSEVTERHKDVTMKHSEVSKKHKDMARKVFEKDKNVDRNDSEVSKKDINVLRKDGKGSKDKDKYSKHIHDRKVRGGDDSDARVGESPKEHNRRKQGNDNYSSKDQKKKKKNKKKQEINEKRNKKKARRKEIRAQRKAEEKKGNRCVGQGHNDKGEG